MNATFDFDSPVIGSGSGFGGSVSALRLAETITAPAEFAMAQTPPSNSGIPHKTAYKLQETA